MPLVRFLFGFFAIVAAIAFVIALTIAYPFWSLVVGASTFFALAATYQWWLWALLRIMARRKTVVVNVQEGTGAMIMQNGKAVRFLTASPATDPDEDWNLTQEDDLASRVQPSVHRTPQRKLSGPAKWIDEHILPGGMRWKGFAFMGYELYEYNFRWEVLRNGEPLESEDGLVGKRKLRGGKWVASFAKRLDYINTKDSVYYLEILDAETKGTVKPDEKGVTKKSVGMPVSIGIVETVRIVNAYLALIFIHDWAQSTSDLMLPPLRSWVGRTSFEDIVNRTEAAERLYDEFLMSTGVLPGTPIVPGEPPTPPVIKVETSYGVRIKRIGFVDIAPPEEYTKAIVLRAEAEQQAVRIQTLADAEAARIETIATAEAKRITTVNEALETGGASALKLRELEALESLGEQGNVFVVNTKGGTPLINVEKTKKGGKLWGSEPGSGQSSGGNPPINQAG